MHIGVALRSTTVVSCDAQSYVLHFVLDALMEERLGMQERGRVRSKSSRILRDHISDVHAL